MNQKALKTLENDKIIEQLASYASSPLGRKKCLELVPSSSLSQITRMQHETHDALTRLFKKGHISFGDAKDIRGALKRLEIGSSMNITELLQTAALLENTARVKAYGRRENAEIFSALKLPYKSKKGAYNEKCNAAHAALRVIC